MECIDPTNLYVAQSLQIADVCRETVVDPAYESLPSPVTLI